MNPVHARRFTELLQQLAAVEATKHLQQDPITLNSREYVNGDQLLNWIVKSKNLLATACGNDSQHFQQFVKSEEPVGYCTNYDVLKGLKAVFLAAKEDFEGGYLTSLRGLVQAEVFASELEQATELLRSGYKVAAAVIAGVVLETTLIDLCARDNIARGKLDRMNADLAKAGVYNLLQQKRITALADIRNKAAHGNGDEFKPDDVAAMIQDVQKFVADHTS